MRVGVLSAYASETEGLKWITAAHMNGVDLLIGERDADCLVIDMDAWTEETEAAVLNSGVPWIGLASDRTFQTAYRALKGHAEDVLFRPFDPMAFVRCLQQIRFRLRNHSGGMHHSGESPIGYADFFSGTASAQGLTLAAFTAEDPEALETVAASLARFPFGRPAEAFLLSDFVLLLYRADDADICFAECSAFLSAWKERADTPLAVFVNGSPKESLKSYYQKTRSLIDLVFYEGYDIISTVTAPTEWRTLDPFLTPPEQRTWIEMLDSGKTAAIRSWLETEFLSAEKPYPDPELVRVRLTSVLAQIRRFMKSRRIISDHWEKSYQEVFRSIVRGPVVYRIVQKLAAFAAAIVAAEGETDAVPGSQAVRKTAELIESRYWDAAWGLGDCAERFGVSKSTLSRQFSEAYGIHFNDMLRSKKLKEAKRLLLETELPMEEVARLSGFSAAPYFSYVFKKTEGCSPTDFRKGR